ncbi:hypothetical protein PR003_g14503 [Phytophthora rubi]|uniref:Uncharacterized protein n=1 Tax=Phytophthora rubi TaxID=129364 RepID=A0A6A3LMV0_9STRA|nr:hypothetical protein PR001_g13801 [Phytophthora rubi]KAE9332472.1 hypothetical protein PR003_g14503 [Phytophthora rubi]
MRELRQERRGNGRQTDKSTGCHLRGIFKTWKLQVPSWNSLARLSYYSTPASPQQLANGSDATSLSF